ncbi:hypothetical protein CDD81_4351 [Ophiocordyceps australis]|uniref:Nitrate reductase n=1 Tax=Ophiocordyceps australis TaxID=1399860 RepID=A0A2C5XUT1_9HYPO|nr:hypothetical protein CDD81_4351 [Ophiocordyceps australis]
MAGLLPPSPPSTIALSRRGSLDGQTALPPLPRVAPKTVLPQDVKTPDSHVARDARLIRLTGTHPFNVEPPLSDLFDQGFLTSEDLHYVRNHGPVPRCQDDAADDWTFSVEGMVANPFTMSLRQLKAHYQQLTYPITLVCAGNRRKEQNVVRKTKGFSWGPAGLSTALWTGVAIDQVLSQARPCKGARYVCFEGADELPNGSYGTSLRLASCLDPARGILIAHGMNGLPLHPDHGKPVRVVVPGQIGGRSVKWLKRIVLTAEPSDNWYHIYDNRVLPTSITPEASADLPQVWRDERYAIYDLNTNSVVCHPAHDERLGLLDATSSSYRARGYAYGGGGRRITRVELTLDKGKSWKLADISYPEDSYRLAPDGQELCGGRLDSWWRDTCFCWCFWHIDLPLAELEAASDVMVRAMDEALSVQPRDMYWSVMGMMNNAWYRVAIHKQGDWLHFEHPVKPAIMSGGWMEKVKKAGGSLDNGFWGQAMPGQDMPRHEQGQDAVRQEHVVMTNPKIERCIGLAELKEHDGHDEPWFVVDGQVYDGTRFLQQHPGGATSIVSAAGQDTTDEFMAIHSDNAKAMMPDFHLGKLAGDALASMSQQTEDSGADAAVFLNPKTWVTAVLHQKLDMSADARMFRFQLHRQDQVLGLPVGQHILVRLKDTATCKPVIRAYTPTSQGQDKGFLDLVVKIYRATPKHPGGTMTLALDALAPGQTVDFKGPMGRFEYLGKGCCSVSGKQRSLRRVYMVCAGSGITPMLQVLRAIAQDPHDATQCLVVNGNRVEGDILCRQQLDDFIDAAKQRCRLLHTLSQPSPSWTGRRGRIDRAILEAEIGRCSQAGHDMVLVCGPQAMEKEVHRACASLGWADDDVLFF